MTSFGSIKDLTKAIHIFMQAPALPFPGDLDSAISSYLARQTDDETGDRLNEELLSIYGKEVLGRPEKYTGFLSILRELRPAIKTPARIFEWWDRLLDPVLEHVGQEKGLAKEVLNITLDLLSMLDGSGTPFNDNQVGLTPFTNRLLKRWMDARANETIDVTSPDFKERMVQKALMAFGKKDPKGFMTCLDNYVVKKEYRNWALDLFCNFVQTQPPHIHLILQTPLFGNILRSLQMDNSTSTVTSALGALIMILPYFPSSLVPLLPTLFNIYARLLFWEKQVHFPQEHAEIGSESERAKAITWEKCLYAADNDGHTITYLLRYFTILYGLYPINFMDYIRKPERYLRHANNADDIDVQASEIRARSERFTELHRLHPNFYNLTIETEKADLSRWKESEAHEVLDNCTALFIEPELGTPDIHFKTSPTSVPFSQTPEENEGDSSDSDAILGGSSKQSYLSTRDSLSASLAPLQQDHPPGLHPLGQSSSMSSRRGSISSHPSGQEPVYINEPGLGGDSPTLPPHLAQPRLQATSCYSNKMSRPDLVQSLATDSVPSLDLNPAPATEEKGSVHAPSYVPQNSATSVRDLDDQVSRLYHENQLLRNDLQFERYLKKQHISHMGELRRKQIREAATVADMENMINANRVIRQGLDAAKINEAQQRREFDLRVNRANRSVTELTNKLKTLRDQQKKDTAEVNDLKHRLEKAQDECERLRKLVNDAEGKRLVAEQRLEAIDLGADEIGSLKTEIARLSASEREYQGKQLAMARALEGADMAKIQAEQLSADLAATQDKLYQTKKDYDSQIAALSAKLDRALKEKSGKSVSEVVLVYESALGASRSNQAELQKQYSSLMRKYTVLQSSLLDMSCEAAEKKASPRDPVSSFGSEAEPSQTARSPMAIQNRAHRGLSDPEAFDGVSHNATPPLEPVSSSVKSPMQRPVTPGGAADLSASGRSTSPQTERYHGRGGVQNASKKDRKEKKDEKNDKRDKKPAAGLRGIRGFV